MAAQTFEPTTREEEERGTREDEGGGGGGGGGWTDQWSKGREKEQLLPFSCLLSHSAVSNFAKLLSRTSWRQHCLMVTVRKDMVTFVGTNMIIIIIVRRLPFYAEKDMILLFLAIVLLSESNCSRPNSRTTTTWENQEQSPDDASLSLFPPFLSAAKPLPFFLSLLFLFSPQEKRRKRRVCWRRR